LEVSGLGQFDYVLGERDGGSHAWLGRNELVVDITADQFEEMPHPVVVERSSLWHASFHTEVLHVADFEIYDDRMRATLRGAYRAVIQCLPPRDAQPFGQPDRLQAALAGSLRASRSGGWLP